MKKTDEPVVVEHIFKVSKHDLWAAITEPAQMKQWFFERMESFQPEVGFKTQFVVENEGRVFPHHWKITDVIPRKKISLNWKYAGYPGDSEVTFELSPADEQAQSRTRLKLTHRTLEDFPDSIEEFSRESCLGGWNYFIKNRLAAYLGSDA